MVSWERARSHLFEAHASWDHAWRPAPRSPRRREVTAQYHPRALRWFLVNTQYRQPINYTQRALEEVRAAWIPYLRCSLLGC